MSRAERPQGKAILLLLGSPAALLCPPWKLMGRGRGSECRQGHGPRGRRGPAAASPLPAAAPSTSSRETGGHGVAQPDPGPGVGAGFLIDLVQGAARLKAGWKGCADTCPWQGRVTPSLRLGRGAV